jgi:CBS domain containing-hemolysin-like protein
MVKKALGHLDDYIAATQLGITLASLALGWVGEPALEHLIEPPIVFLFGSAGEALSTGISVAVAFIIITSLHIILGELAPKSVALQRSEGTTLFVIRPLDLFLRIFRPFIWVLNSAGRGVVRLFGLGAVDEHAKIHSVEELEMLIVQSHKAGVLDAQEETLLRKVFEFDDKTARQIMVPRTEMVGISENASLHELVKMASSRKYTRLPVFRDTLDQIVGVIHLKDLIPVMESLLYFQTGVNGDNRPASSDISRQLESSIDIKTLIRPALNVPESIQIADLLTQMRVKRAHLAVVIDEYGGTAGIVTLEDVVEELVGEVQDEFDSLKAGVIPEIETLPDGSILINGLFALETAEDRFDLQLDQEKREGIDTLGGYIVSLLGRVPVEGDEIKLGHYQVRVEKMDNLRVAQLRLRQNSPARENKKPEKYSTEHP